MKTLKYWREWRKIKKTNLDEVLVPLRDLVGEVWQVVLGIGGLRLVKVRVVLHPSDDLAENGPG